MAQFIIPIKDANLKAEIEAAFAGAFANPDLLTNEALVILHTSNYIRNILNNSRLQDAITEATESTSTLATLE